ncbi:MAG: hypothetical protein GXP31_17300 [Kiritimatiellaeota bacterium]|nr:hypothetical protein [Kiritimatiellota bacterium]
MSPAESGDNPFGTWVRDEANLPCYVLLLRDLPPAFPALRHHVANGCIHFLGDSAGRLSVLTGAPDRSLRLSAPQGGVFSAVYLRLAAADGKVSVLPADGLAAGGDGRLVWGVPYLRYEGHISREGTGLAFSFEVAVPRYTPAGQIEICLKNESDAPFEGIAEVICELAPFPRGPDIPPVSLFQREGIVIRPDLREDIGDFFLAGGTEWECAGKGSRLVLQAPVRLAPAAEVAWRFLLGTSRECSFATVRDQYAEMNPEVIRARWAEALMHLRIRAPELWMQQECLWSEGRLSGFLDVRSVRNTAPAINPGGRRFFRGIGAAARLPRGLLGTGVREMLGLALPLVETVPGQALAALDRVMCCQSSAGRVPERLEIQAVQDRVRPAADRSDLEVLFLAAWAWFLRREPATAGLDRECPFQDGAPGTRWEHIKRACDWVRHELGTGPHGLVRVLAGDWNGWLDRMGTSGRGESTLNTAMLIWALRPVIDTARRREDPVLADRLEDWRQQLAEAVAEAFDGNRFVRGYTDQGRPVGAGPNEPVFADAQAWAVLARCGTTLYRDKALQFVLETCLTSAGIAALSTPYPPPPPEDVSSFSTCPGLGENGGVSATVNAWMAWALASEGRADLGFRVWEAASLRRRTTGSDALPPALVGVTDWLNGPGCPLGGGLPAGVAENGGPWPEAAAFAWRAFGMRRLLEK